MNALETRVSVNTGIATYAVIYILAKGIGISSQRLRLGQFLTLPDLTASSPQVRNSTFRILPLAVVGQRPSIPSSPRKNTYLGTLYRANLFATNFLTSSLEILETCSVWGSRSTNAPTTSPYFSSAMATTEACRIPG